MTKYKNYRLCPVLTDDDSDWECLKRDCHFYFNNSCWLSLVKEGLKKIILDKLKGKRK